jgi:hypothetical protein
MSILPRAFARKYLAGRPVQDIVGKGNYYPSVHRSRSCPPETTFFVPQLTSLASCARAS